MRLVDGVDLHLELVAGHHVKDLVDAQGRRYTNSFISRMLLKKLQGDDALEETGTHDLGGVAAN